jgi:hypothetical protein
MSIPGQVTLLEVALQYLESELLPTLEGEHRFKTRLAINALRIVQREGAAIQDILASTEPELSTEQPSKTPLFRRISSGPLKKRWPSTIQNG